MTFKYVSLALGAFFFSSTTLAAQNEIVTGLTHNDGLNSGFLGAQYIRYLENIDANTDDPLLLAPYLQRTNSVRAIYSRNDPFNSFTIGSDYYLGDEWLLSGDVTYARNRSDYEKDDNVGVDLRAGYFVSDQWQVGMRGLYEYRSGEFDSYRLVNDEWVPYVREHSDDRSTVGLYTRYTTIKNGSGWDLYAAYLFNRDNATELSADYYFNPRFSMGMGLLHMDRNGYSRDVVSLNTNYWFTSSFSMSLSAGQDVSDGSGLDSLTLLGSWRF